MFNKISLLALLNVAIIGKKIKLFKFQSGKHTQYYTVKDVKFTGPKRNHPEPRGEAIGEVVSVDSEPSEHEGDWIGLRAKIDDIEVDISIESITDVLILA